MSKLFRIFVNMEMTIKEWLELLPEPIRSKALDKMYSEKNYTGDALKGSLESVIFGAFDWDGDTTYWSDAAYSKEYAKACNRQLIINKL